MLKFKPGINERCADWAHPHATLRCMGCGRDIEEAAVVPGRREMERHATCNGIVVRGTCFSPATLTAQVRL